MAAASAGPWQTFLHNTNDAGDFARRHLFAQPAGATAGARRRVPKHIIDAHGRGQDVSGLIKSIRRIAIVAIVGLAYLYFRNFTGPGTLTQIGLLSFTAVAQFAPSIVGGVYWKRGRYQGVIAGLGIGA